MPMYRRREVIGAAGALLIPCRALALTPLHGFTHGVASGEPGPDRVLLWTRYRDRGDVRLRVEVAATPAFARILAGGDAIASIEQDHTAKLVVSGLAPGRWYYYRFVAADGTKSVVGRTRTLPEKSVDAFTLGVFSCANMGFGYFNAYSHAAARADIDLMLHLGDYQYEYGRDYYPTAAEAVARRTIEPAGETIDLAAYRARYAAYRADPDLRALHARFPMIAMWDDHEIANDSWRDGAENHDPATEGSWLARRTAAIRAYREWMPVSDEDWAEYRIGTLAALFRPEERLTARTRPVSLADALAGEADPAAALARFRDTVWSDPAHTLLGEAQEGWLAGRMRAAAKETRWQVFAQQVNLGYTRMPADAVDWARGGDPQTMGLVMAGLAAAKAGMPFFMTSWNGYPAARSRLLRTGLEADANLVVLSGDSHNAWAFDLREDDRPAGVEFGGHSVTSPGYESLLPHADPVAVARGLVAASPELRWAETARRGYMTVRLTPERVTTDWLFLDTVRARSTRIAASHRASVEWRARRLS